MENKFLCVCLCVRACVAYVLSSIRVQYIRHHKIEAKMHTVTLSKAARYKMEKYLYCITFWHQNLAFKF
jgi:hypothetical protein